MPDFGFRCAQNWPRIASDLGLRDQRQEPPTMNTRSSPGEELSKTETGNPPRQQPRELQDGSWKPSKMEAQPLPTSPSLSRSLSLSCSLSLSPRLSLSLSRPSLAHGHPLSDSIRSSLPRPSLSRPVSLSLSHDPLSLSLTCQSGRNSSNKSNDSLATVRSQNLRSHFGSRKARAQGQCCAAASSA